MTFQTFQCKLLSPFTFLYHLKANKDQSFDGHVSETLTCSADSIFHLNNSANAPNRRPKIHDRLDLLFCAENYPVLVNGRRDHSGRESASSSLARPKYFLSKQLYRSILSAKDRRLIAESHLNVFEERSQRDRSHVYIIRHLIV